jgi:hypothetical protein
MSQTSNRHFLVAIILLTFAAIPPLQAQELAAQTTAIDSTLYTTYSGGRTTVYWTVCGATQQSEGCYDSGSIGPFVGVGAMLEGDPSVKGNEVTRLIYVVDSGSATSVKLYVYRKVDTITVDFDTTTVTLARTVTLPLIGGNSVVCFMAANRGFLFIATDQTSYAVEVRKSKLSVSNVGGFSPPINVTSITADQYGYVTVTQAGGFTVLGPDGLLQEDGGGTDFVLNTVQAVSATALLATDAPPAPRLGYRPKTAHQTDAK